jgi:hypothetical protein
MFVQVHEASQRAPDCLRVTTSTVLVSIFDLRARGIEFDLAVTFLSIDTIIYLQLSASA